MTNNQNRFEAIDNWELIIIWLLKFGDWNLLLSYHIFKAFRTTSCKIPLLTKIP